MYSAHTSTIVPADGFFGRVITLLRKSIFSVQSQAPRLPRQLNPFCPIMLCISESDMSVSACVSDMERMEPSCATLHGPLAGRSTESETNQGRGWPHASSFHLHLTTPRCLSRPTTPFTDLGPMAEARKQSWERQARANVSWPPRLIGPSSTSPDWSRLKHRQNDRCPVLSSRIPHAAAESIGAYTQH